MSIIYLIVTIALVIVTAIILRKHKILMFFAIGAGLLIMAALWVLLTMAITYSM